MDKHLLSLTSWKAIRELLIHQFSICGVHVPEHLSLCSDYLIIDFILHLYAYNKLNCYKMFSSLLVLSPLEVVFLCEEYFFQISSNTMY